MRRDDLGVSLIELLVVMSLLLTALAMFGVAFSATLRTSSASRAMGDATDQVRTGFGELERQVRFGYWVRPETGLGCGANCAVTVLTQNADGTKECWTWALDSRVATNVRLVSIHRPYSTGFTMPLPVGSAGWHVAAEGIRMDLHPASLVTSGNTISSLDVSTLARVTYYVAAEADVWVGSSGGTSQVPLRIQMGVRNGWRGAYTFAGGCP